MIINLFRERVLRRVMHIMASRKPDFVVGEASDPYMKRWRLLPKGPWPNIYFHEFCKSDDDVLHDHPVANISWVLRLGYWEHRLVPVEKAMIKFVDLTREDAEMYAAYEGVVRKHWVPPGAVKFRWAKTPHRIEVTKLVLNDASTGRLVQRNARPITIFICGPRTRDWGFWCPQGWKPWQKYVATTSYGNRIGPGCEDL